MSEVLYKGEAYSPDTILLKLNEFLTPERLNKIERVVEKRSDYFVPVLEDLYDRGNVSAVMRSSEAFGFYKMHIIQSSEAFKESKRVTQGADKWLDVYKWMNTKDCITNLKEEGYKVYSTSLSDDAVSFMDLDFSQKTAVVLGNEKEGVSKEALSLSDGNVLLPMEGFTQSFNISVAAALCFQAAKIKNPTLIDNEEQKRLKALYFLKTLDWPTSVLNETLSR